jgi:hypothetical protein
MGPRRQLDAGHLFAMRKIAGMRPRGLLAALQRVPLCEDEE